MPSVPLDKAPTASFDIFLPYADDVATKMPEQIVQEGDDFNGRDVLMRMPVRVEAKMASTGRDRKGAEGPHLFVASGAAMEDRCVAFRRPSRHHRTPPDNDPTAFRSRGALARASGAAGHELGRVSVLW